MLLIGAIYLMLVCCMGVGLSGDALGYLSNGAALLKWHRQMPNIIQWSTINNGGLGAAADLPYPNHLFSLIYATLFKIAGNHSAIMVLPGFIALMVGIYSCSRYAAHFLGRQSVAWFVIYFFIMFHWPMLVVNRTDLYSWALMMLITVLAYERPRQTTVIGLLLGLAILLRAQCWTFIPFVPFLFSDLKPVSFASYFRKLLGLVWPLVLVVLGWSLCMRWYMRASPPGAFSLSIYFNEIERVVLPKLNPLKLCAILLEGGLGIAVTYFGPFSLLLIMGAHRQFKAWRSPALCTALLCAVPILLMPYVMYQTADDARYYWYGIFYLALFIWHFLDRLKEKQPWVTAIQCGMLLYALYSSSLLKQVAEADWSVQAIAHRLTQADHKELRTQANHLFDEQSVIMAPGMDYGAANMRGAWLHVFLNTSRMVQVVDLNTFTNGNHNELIDGIILMNNESCDVPQGHEWNYVPGWFETAVMQDEIIDKNGHVFKAVAASGPFVAGRHFYKIYARTARVR